MENSPFMASSQVSNEPDNTLHDQVATIVFVQEIAMVTDIYVLIWRHWPQPNDAYISDARFLEAIEPRGSAASRHYETTRAKLADTKMVFFFIFHRRAGPT